VTGFARGTLRGGSGLRFVSIGILVFLVATGQPPHAAELSEDEYVFRLAGCVACHTHEGGGFLAGGPALETPFGTFYAPNITAHREEGIGTWSEADLRRALGEGVGPDGAHYYPVFPYTSYTRMSDDDVGRIYRFLMAVPPDPTPRREHDLPWFMEFRIVNWFWKRLFFDEGRYVADPARSAAWNRGAYLATALAHCGECHSPRNRFGGVGEDHLAGNPSGPEGGAVPNITPHEEKGIGRWTAEEIVDYLTSGALPDGDYAGGVMAEVIDEGLVHLKPRDAKAIAEYLRALPPSPGAD